jgi:hypothetical protein
MSATLLRVCGATLAVLTATDARAEPPVRASFAILGGYGFNDSNANGGGAMNLYGPAAGARAGVTLAQGPYAGASFVWHAGFARDLGAGATADGRVIPIGIELGYEARIDRFAVRPYVGGGVATYSSRYVIDAQHFEQGDGNKPAVWPGVVVTADVAERAFVGVDARYTLIPTGSDPTVVSAGGGSASGPELLATLGLRV